MADGADQIIVAAEVTAAANDKQQAVPMGRAALANLEAAGIERPRAADGTEVPIPNTADTGYFSDGAVAGLERIGLDPYIAVERQKHHERGGGIRADGRGGGGESEGEDAAKLGSATGKVLYAARKRIIEPVFGQMKGRGASGGSCCAGWRMWPPSGN